MARPRLHVRGNFWLVAGGHSLAGRGRIELLERIGETGSIRQAALAMGMSYRAAWQAVDAMNRRAGVKLVTRLTGGRGGGGARLGVSGRKLIAAFRTLETEHARLLQELDARLADLA